MRLKWLGQAQVWRYGAVADVPVAPRTERLHQAWPPGSPARMLTSWRVWGDHDVTFVLRLLQPHQGPGGTGSPVVLSGDACWLYLDASARDALLAEGLAVAWFDRTEVAPDPPDAVSAAGAAGSALARWAWAYRCAASVLTQTDGIDARRLVLHGHSRGGKAALLAGALDERVWLTAAHNAGCAGSASDCVAGQGAETLADLAARFPHWLSPSCTQRLLGSGAGGGAAMGDPGFDTWQLAACVAPRRLLIAQSVDDLWANPDGVRHAYERWQQVFDALGASRRVQVMWRQGPHQPALEDWQRLARSVALAAREDGAAP